MLQCLPVLFGGPKASLLDSLACPADKPFDHVVCLPEKRDSYWEGYYALMDEAQLTVPV